MTKLQLKPIKDFHYNYAEEQEFKRSNIFDGIPKGFIIIDSYNNPFYPINILDLDDNKLSYPSIKQELLRKNWTGYFTPWHYWVEFVNMDYIAIQGRPLNYRTPLPGFEDYIVICIAGNSNNDIYLKHLYKSLADILLNSLHYLPSWRLQAQEKTTLLNLGKSFDENQLIKYLK